MRTVYVWDEEAKAFVERKKKTEEPSVSKVHYISDTMEPTFHPCDGKYYESKSRFRAVTKAHGKTEIGNDTSWLKESSEKDNSAEIKRAIWQAWDKLGYK